MTRAVSYLARYRTTPKEIVLRPPASAKRDAGAANWNGVCYSTRSVVIGSTRAARHPGAAQAIRDTPTMSATTPR